MIGALVSSLLQRRPEPVALEGERKNLTEETHEKRNAQLLALQRHLDTLLIQHHHLEDDIHHVRVGIQALEASMEVLEAALAAGMSVELEASELEPEK